MAGIDVRVPELMGQRAKTTGGGEGEGGARGARIDRMRDGGKSASHREEFPIQRRYG